MSVTRRGIVLIIVVVIFGGIAVGSTTQFLMAQDSADDADRAFARFVSDVGKRALTTCVDQAVVSGADAALGHRAALAWREGGGRHIDVTPKSLSSCVDIFLAEKHVPDELTVPALDRVWVAGAVVDVDFRREEHRHDVLSAVRAHFDGDVEDRGAALVLTCGAGTKRGAKAEPFHVAFPPTTADADVLATAANDKCATPDDDGVVKKPRTGREVDLLGDDAFIDDSRGVLMLLTTPLVLDGL